MKVRKLAVERDQVVVAYNNGASLKDLATQHSVSRGTIRNVLLEENVTLRAQGRPKKNGAPVRADEATTTTTTSVFSNFVGA